MDGRSAELCGREAMRGAVSGKEGVLVGLERDPGSADSSSKLVSLADVARIKRQMPAEFLAASSTDITQAYLDYARLWVRCSIFRGSRNNGF